MKLFCSREEEDKEEHFLTLTPPLHFSNQIQTHKLNYSINPFHIQN